jgi:hypothetical protein
MELRTGDIFLIVEWDIHVSAYKKSYPCRGLLLFFTESQGFLVGRTAMQPPD